MNQAQSKTIETTKTMSAVEKLYRSGCYSEVKSYLVNHPDDVDAQDFASRTTIDKVSLFIGFGALILTVLVAYFTLTFH